MSSRQIPLVFGFALLAMPSSADETKEIALFNGKDLTGWRSFADPKAKGDTSNIWTVRDGMIVCAGKPQGFLSTEKEYSNYVLHLEWRWADTTSKENRYSSVFAHVTGPDKNWPRGVDATLSHKACGQFWLVDGFKMDVDPKQKDPKSGRHYFPTRTDAEKPLGEWNQMDLTCSPKSVEVRINGILVNQGKNPSENKGRIILLSEGGEVHFRKLVVKPLASAE